MTDPLDRPRLRPGLAAARDERDPQVIVVYDERRLTPQFARLSPREFTWVQWFDGRQTLRDIQSAAMRQAGGSMLPLETLQALVERLDAAHLLDSPRFRALLTDPIRQPSCIGCYDADPAALRLQLSRLFTDAGGPGLPDPKHGPGDGPRLRAALVPHIDYARGGVTYGWGFKEIAERTDASLFVIIGTSHYSPARFTLTRQHFQTPLGVARTDQTYIDRLVSRYGDDLFDDPVAHLPEHSIELEVVLLQYLFENRRPIRIVPLLVGSFGDCVRDGEAPAVRADIARMIAALQQVEAATPEPICTIISGDLAHVGPKFDDPDPVAEPFLSESRVQDQKILERAAAVDPAGYFGVIAAEGDARRICGLPPTYTALAALQPRSGRLLHYGRYVHPQGFESVSFASMAFYA